MQGLRGSAPEAYSKYVEDARPSVTLQMQTDTASQQISGEKPGLALQLSRRLTVRWTARVGIVTLTSISESPLASGRAISKEVRY